MRYQMVEDRSVAEQTHEIINLEHALADAEMKLPEKFLVIIEEEHRNQTHKMPVEHHPRANLIVGKQKVNKVNSNSKAISKSKTTKNKKPKANKPCWNCGQVGHWPNFVLIKRQRLGRQLSTWLWEVLVPQEQLKGHHWKDSKHGELQYCCSTWDRKRGLEVSFRARSVIKKSSPRSHCQKKHYQWFCIVREGYELAFKFNKVVIQQFGIFVGKGYLDDGLFKVRVENNKNDMSDSIVLNVESSTLWHSRLETQTGKKLKRLRSDRGGEYESSKFNEYCQTFGIIHEETPPYSPSSNGVAERKNRTFKDMINSLLLTSGLPKYLWGEALNTACHILNRVPLKRNTSTPFELWKEIPGIEVNTIVEFRDAVFIEDVFPMKTGIPSSVSLDDSLTSTSIPEHVEKMTNVGVSPSSTSLTHEELDEPRRSKRARGVKDFGSDFVTYNIEDDPVTFKDAMAFRKLSNGKKLSKVRWTPLFLTEHGTRLTTIRVLIALASVYSLPIHQMDVKTAFLYGELEEEIYMDQPEGFVAHAISQSHYVEKIIEKFGYQNSRIAKTPYDPSIALFKNEVGISVTQLRYSQIIGSLQYLANGTRPDISFSVSKLARYTSCPDRTHWSALDRVLRYLKGTVSLAIHYGRFPAALEGYSDASWIAKNSGSNGCSGYVFTLGGGAISWKSAKQTLITRSTFEAKLCALDTTGTEAEWLFGLLSQLPILSQPLPPIAVHCDSQITIAKVRSRKYNQKTKRHIQVRLKSIRALVSDRVIGIDFVGTKDNVADPLTKGLDLSQVNKSRLGMGLKTHQ
ncbi:UNVERIFIED_CONTAM: Retrovirus-related Pol polyprotein from transposon TNT 1-94 [Sesamum radiatum]|uniref:Retrovirus-related Pol polyprotein from transposon TNT 1-94 n=1 Tax=Sesamum radiatum TaxID=300843 RepID=A0AAW2PY88_SESRA